ncbi:unnamed protein product [Cylicocyclus nassatus]|uniref:Uncharacterized protein n=1 Tax=Cylicocyclus nassatus TaxID=53992 RepID=A0AA36GV20_CYLNA|nr:unnamed protein product [Cylicocyclus nassatus]
MYFAVFSALLCISSGAPFIGQTLLDAQLAATTPQEEQHEYPAPQENSESVVLEPPLIKRGIDPLSIPRLIREPPLKRIDPFSIPRLIREPPLKRGEKRDSYVYPLTSSQLDRIPLREPPLKRGYYEDEEQNPSQDPTEYGASYMQNQQDDDWQTSAVRTSKQPTESLRKNIYEYLASIRRQLPPSILQIPTRQMRSSTGPRSPMRLWR